MEKFFPWGYFFTHDFFCAPLKIKYHIYVYSTFKFIISEVVSLKNFWSCIPPTGGLGVGYRAEQMSKGWFSAELLKMVHKKQLIFIVDEWSFTRSVKAEYSWLPVGKSSSVINDVQKGSSSLIFSIGSNELWFGLIKHGTIDSKIFWIFLNLLFDKLCLNQTEHSKMHLL